MSERFLTRREALAAAARAALLVPLAAAVPALRAQDAPPPGARAAAPARFTLGLAGYSLSKLPIDEAIAALQELQITSFSAFKVHVPILISTPGVCRDAAAKFRGAGITLAGTGVVYLENREGSMRRAFECGRAAGLSMMTASFAQPPDRAALLLTERFARDYDMRLAFHNHGPEDRVFPSPTDVWKAVQPYDERLGLCIDVGHSARAGVDPVEAIRTCRARLYDVHLKDTLAAAGALKDLPAGLGQGRLDIRGIMEALIRVDYRGQAGLEYEVRSPDPIPGIAQSFGYMRGLLAALAPAPTLS